MTLPTRVKQILDEPFPSITWLRSSSKEDLVRTVLEMKRVYSDYSMKKMDMDHSLAMAQLELKKIELQSKLEATNGMIGYGVEIKEHKYGPKAIGHVSTSLATIWNGEGLSVTGSGKPIADLDLATRADLAEGQGIVWNLQNKRPERNSTIRKKVEAWENGIKRGMEADPAIFCTKDPDDVKEMGPDHRAFMTGLCMQMEASLGVDQQHRYLIPRFKNISKRYKETIQPTVEPATAVPPESAEKKARALIQQIHTEWLGPNHQEKIRKKDEESGTLVPGTPALKRAIERHVQLVVNMGLDETIRDRRFGREVLWDLTQPYTLPLIKDNLDWGVLCGRDPEYVDYSDIYRAYELTPGRKQAFTEAFDEWWSVMCDREGL